VIAVLGGLGAALCWAASSLCARRSSRVVGPYSAVAWVMVIGLFLLAPPALVLGTPAGLDGSSSAWALGGAAGAVAGLVAMYAALRDGKVGVVAPIASAEGAIAAVIAIAFGERLGVLAGIVLLVIVAGIVLASSSPGEEGGSRRATGVWFAVGAAVCFGASLYGLGRAGDDIGPLWTLLITRLVGVAALVAPLLLLRRLHFHREALPFLLASGVLEVLGGTAYIVGAGHGIAIASVMASQMAALVVAGGYLLLGERLSRVQQVGVGVVLAGVAVLSALQV
jgi:drug/metabolite transporter (DMT)-like permease